MNRDNKLYDMVRKIGIPKLIILGLTGVALIILCIPENKKADNSSKEILETTESRENQAYIADMENKLTGIIANIDGVEEVKVIINYNSTWRRVVLEETPYSYSEITEEAADGHIKKEINESKDSSVIKGNDDNPYITMELVPQIQGIAVTGKGCDNMVCKEKIINIILALFPIDINKIAVVGK